MRYHHFLIFRVQDCRRHCHQVVCTLLDVMWLTDGFAVSFERVVRDNYTLHQSKQLVFIIYFLSVIYILLLIHTSIQVMIRMLLAHIKQINILSTEGVGE